VIRQLVGPALYALLLVGILCACFEVRDELRRIVRVRHWLRVLGEEEEEA
jgi:hypothetical protein